MNIIDRMLDSFSGAMLLFVLAFAVIAGSVVAIQYPLSRASCSAKAEQMNMPHQYGLWTDCMVQDKHGRWWPIERYSHITVTGYED